MDKSEYSLLPGLAILQLFPHFRQHPNSNCSSFVSHSFRMSILIGRWDKALGGLLADRKGVAVI